MLIGAHVSPAGGLPKAIERGVERGCGATQIFNQPPRQWKPTRYSDENVAAFREAMAASPIEAVLIHAVYLINCASEDKEISEKSLTSLTHSLRVGQAIGASAVIIHPGSAKTGHVGAAIARAGKTIAAALADSEGCELHLEDTAGAGGTLGRSFEELAELIDAAGASKRLGVCLDSCHLLASGYDIRTPEKMTMVLRESSRILGRGTARSLHLNDSQRALGSHRDRPANIGKGELGRKGCSAFLSAASIQKLPCVLETPGESREGPSRAEVALARRWRKQAITARG